MTTPTPPAQDGERITCPYCVIVCKCGYEREIARDTAVQKRIDTDAETIRNQSDELAALRAQVEGLRNALEYIAEGNVEHFNFEEYRSTVEDFRETARNALAPPQPVAKETKP
jgi:hypothetical protein